MTSFAPTIDSLWCSLLVRRVRWKVSECVSDPRILKAAQELEVPILRSMLGKRCRRSVCPETRWQADCGSCSRLDSCRWPRLFPGSAVGLPTPGRLADWVLTQEQGGLLSSHFGLDSEGLRLFGRALDDAFSDSLGLDRRRPGADPRWLCPVLMDGNGLEPVMEIPWSGEVPMSPPPVPIAKDSRIRFHVPLDMKTADAVRPPRMGDWLRLGRNRIHRLVVQNGFQVWPKADPRWSALSRDAADASWMWDDPVHGSPWRPLPKYRLSLTGWMGEVQIQHIPESWVPWATLFPVAGVGSHIPYGCGIARFLSPEGRSAGLQRCTPQPPETKSCIIPLKWRKEIVDQVSG